jgi:hypothetical protein
MTAFLPHFLKKVSSTRVLVAPRCSGESLSHLTMHAYVLSRLANLKTESLLEAQAFMAQEASQERHIGKSQTHG